MKPALLTKGTFFLTIAAALMQPQYSFSQNPDSKFFIYLGFGQSNMQGKGAIELCDVDPYGTYFGNSNWERFRKLVVYDTDKSRIGTWTDARPPIVRPDTGLGPSDYFGRYLVNNLDSTYKIGVVTVAVDGASIQAFNTDATVAKAYISHAESWVVNAAACYGNYPYGKLLEMARIAQQAGVIKGIIFHQGESDVTGATQATANIWYERVTDIYRSLLKDLNLSADSVPFIAGEPLTAEKGGSCGSAIQWVDKLPAYMNGKMGTECCYVASSKGLGGMDQYHFSSQSYRTLGARYGEIALGVLIKQGVTGIATPVAETDNLPVYNINGQKLDEPGQGLNIINGRKYYIDINSRR